MSKVLYVDDNDDNVYMLKMRLELLGDFEVITAEDGEKGYEMVCTERPDIVLMDLEMPGISGWEAAKRIKSNPETRDIPVLALSAHALAGEREKALAAGCDEFDTKPVEFDRLVAKLRQLLARISHTTEDWAPGKPILSDAGPAPRVFVAPKALYVGNFLDLRGSVSCARNDRAGPARVMPGRRGRWQRLRAGLRRVPNLARPGRPMPWRS